MPLALNARDLAAGREDLGDVGPAIPAALRDPEADADSGRRASGGGGTDQGPDGRMIERHEPTRMRGGVRRSGQRHLGEQDQIAVDSRVDDRQVGRQVCRYIAFRAMKRRKHGPHRSIIRPRGGKTLATGTSGAYARARRPLQA